MVRDPRRGDHSGKSRTVRLVLLSLIWRDFGPRRGSRLVFRLMWDFSISCVTGKTPFFFVLCHLIVSVGCVQYIIYIQYIYLFTLSPQFPCLVLLL